MNAFLPINNARLTAGYKNAQYQRRFGFAHYGTDMVSTTSSRNVVAPFDMKIVKKGEDSLMGNTIIAKSHVKVHIHHGKLKGRKVHLVMRLAHLDSFITDKELEKLDLKDDVIPRGTIIAKYGNTSGIVQDMGAHLHIELDTDVRHPFHSPTLKGNGSIWKAGARGAGDTTINPMDVLKAASYQGFAYTRGDLPYLSLAQDLTTLDGNHKIKRATRL